MRARGWIAAGLVASAASVVALAWPAPEYPGPPAPVPENEKLDLYQDALDQQWDSFFAGALPDVDRPDVDTVEVLPTRERDVAFGRCLEDLGFTVRRYGTGIAIESPSDGDQETPIVGQFTCESRYPYETQLDYLMSIEQRSALYDYYTGYLPSCLAFMGVEVTSTPPSRGEFVATSVQWPTWSPYEAVWGEEATPEEYAETERRCPSDPAWRREANSLSTVDG